VYSCFGNYERDTYITLSVRSFGNETHNNEMSGQSWKSGLALCKKGSAHRPQAMLDRYRLSPFPLAKNAIRVQYSSKF
jgi:hypothetical protein